MKTPRWIIQDNNFSHKDRQAMLDACKTLDIPYELITVIPFSKELPDIPLGDDFENIYYGSTTLMERIYKDLNAPKGLFYHEETFRMENYIKQWGKHVLSSEAKVLKFSDFVQENHPDQEQFFIRPDADSKAFNGMVQTFGDIKAWYKRILDTRAVDIGPDTMILAGPAYHIEKEWRNFIVDGKIITSSTYLKNFEEYHSADDIPEEMLTFVKNRMEEYVPHPVFTMDIAKCSGAHEYYIIECGCMNSVGFYKADIFKYVKEITSFIVNTN